MIKNEFELYDMDQKRLIRDLRSRIRDQNMHDFDQLNKYQGITNEGFRKELESKDMEIEQLKEEMRTLRQELQRNNDGSSTNIRSGLDTFRKSGFNKGDMETSNFLNTLLNSVYRNIRDLYENVGMATRTRDIEKLIECLASITSLTID
jgi:predicted RNase H-like nuclease (RuvC/YqgF family)